MDWTRSRRAPLLVVLGMFLGCGACVDRSGSAAASAAASTGAVIRPAPPPFPTAPDTAAAVQACLERGADPVFGQMPPAARAELSALYAQSRHAPLWFDASGTLSHQGREALAALHDAPLDGLAGADYRHDELVRRSATVSALATDLADLDVAISRAVLRYVRHLHLGRIDPRTLGFKLRVPAEDHDFVALLYAAHAEDRVAAMIADLRPTLGQYDALRAMLARYRALALDADLAMPLPQTAAVRPGDVYPGADVLSRRLVAFGDWPADEPTPLPAARYEGALVDAVMRFQVRHGLTPDGVLGKQTQEALRVPVAERARQIELALERLRWLPDFVDQGLLAINIPMFRLWAWSTNPPEGTPTLAMDTIVGRAVDTQTPVFDHEIREIIFRPFWNVPRSIAVAEILPAIARDAGFLARENMEIVRGNRDDAPVVAATSENLALVPTGALRVRQRPGKDNALGLVKFVFPNEENVYLHGTPAQELFRRDRRDFSHGCVRVEDPVALAEWVLRETPEWTRDRIVAAMTGAEDSVRVRLARPLHIVLFYTTAVVNPADGAVYFAEDIYRHDRRLDRALAR